jgi:hypothetical protein
MKLNRPLFVRAAGRLAAVLVLGTLPFAQEQGPELPDIAGLDEQQEEMVKLFHEVERTLLAIDLELADAGAGRIPPPEGKDSGIERLLLSYGSKSDQAVSGIEKILELAQQMNGQSMSQCMKPDQGGQSPLDKEKQSAPKQQESTPQEPKPGEQKDQPQPTPNGEKPHDGQQSPPPQSSKKSSPPGAESGDAVPHGTDAERWGQLPERVQNVFQNQITDDLPLQYRDWIDAYYRRLNKVR